MSYGWIIDKDYIADETADQGTLLNAKGLCGPSDIPAFVLADLRHGSGDAFRLYDDDGELYYQGRFIDADDDWTLEYQPLYDFGEPNAGCTMIKYKQADGSWKLI